MTFPKAKGIAVRVVSSLSLIHIFFPTHPDAIARTVEIANRCQVEFEFGKYHLPQFDVPDGYTAREYLDKLCLEGLHERYPDDDGTVRERLDYEINMIDKMGFVDYFLIVSDFIHYAKRNGIPAVSYTHLDVYKRQGIPGTLGGAVFMNAGAYGGQMADIMVRTHYLDGEGKIGTIEGDAHQFGYRESVFKSNPDWIVLSSELRLSPDSADVIREKMQDYAQRRRDKQPLEFPSAGSTFKRPEGYFAGKLIQDSGLMGYTVGGAQVSEKHAGFLINRGGATCADMPVSYTHLDVYKRQGDKLNMLL